MAAFGFASFDCIRNSRLLLVGWFLYMVTAFWLVHLTSYVSVKYSHVPCLPCLPFGCSSCQLYLPDLLLVCFACLSCLLVGLSCQLCLPTIRLLAGWFCLLSITSYWLVLPA